MNPEVEQFFNSASQWQSAYHKLRSIVLDCGLTEELKWKQPCYTYQSGKPGKGQVNVLMIAGFKEFCALSFLKGVLLDDSQGLLQKPGENSHSVRYLKFTEAGQITKAESIIKSYIYEAIEVERAGLEVILEKNREPIPQELEERLNKNPDLKTAFYALTLGKQRGYILYFSAPKQSKLEPLELSNTKVKF
ncbi:MAG: hypothetical protein ACJAUV_002284 [Flavobacteriales bacterium]|jgi:uncharacterized protein YdeI (YjbR/CyaY-like superfamily)